jgi:osmotically-inducible protein OsmY
MKSDSQIREEVIQELGWDPQVTDPDVIGVAVKDGAVTLTGAVSTYAQKFAAVRAASRVYGVKAVADELTVKPTGEPRDDSDIARAIAHILDNNTQIPEGKVHAQVRAGWVTLNGEVEWQYQRLEVERMVQHVRGVVGISNNIIVTPKVSPAQVQAQVQAKIEEAFKREAEIDARHISVAVSDHTASLYGHVHSLNEANAARAAAASAPGIASVESHLIVTP